MGNVFRKKKKYNRDEPVQQVAVADFDYQVHQSPVQQWEDKQKERNVLLMEKMREDFYNRPDRFLLNLLVVSLQFYRNYNREKVDIGNHIRDREQALGKKLNSSKRKVIYMGGFEEISGTHVLYQAKGEQYMELPCPLQIYLVQDNVEIHPGNQLDNLQKLNYADVDGPFYRFCTEYSKKHKGYVRLRCADIIPGDSRKNTYESIYGYLKPAREEDPDPVVDIRPLRRSSLAESTDEEGDAVPHLPLFQRMQLLSMSSFEEEEEETSDEEMTPPPMSALKQRRPSGILPINYPAGGLQRKSSKGKPIQMNGSAGGRSHKDEPKVDVPNLSERRPSGLFPKLAPNMDQLTFSKKEKRKIKTEDEFADLKRSLALIEEESEEEEEDDNENMGEKNISFTIPSQIPEDEDDDKDSVKTQRLHSSLNTGCFVCRKIKLKQEGDAYGINTVSETRRYFSSERYLECFEDDFEVLLEILGKKQLCDTCNVQMPAILTSELMIEGIGPKINVEFIPTLVIKEWPECAFEWKLRDRKSKPDPDTKMIYRWPKPQYIHEVTKMGCNLVPIGHYNPNNPNTVMTIEWQIQFSRAEQLLLRSLGHTQLRLLMLVEFMMRDHLKDVPGLKTQHLRYILFWMCEHNFRDWQEERLGIKLKAYFKTLYNCLSTENLPHYFVDKCNMMENIPQKYLRQMQATVRHMKENLPMYLMHTMRRMQAEDDFYPLLDMKEIYKLVTPEHWGMEKVNPNLLQLIDPVDDGEDVLYSDSEEEEDVKKMKERLHRLRDQKSQKQTNGKNDQKKKEKPATINLKKKVQQVNDLRSGKLLSTFAKHFIQMARSSNKYRSYPQAYMYLLMAGNMANLLEETNNYEEARDFRKEIEELNFASRGGVQDMLGTSWSIADNYDIVPGMRAPHGSNWELKENQPLPKPPEESSVTTDKLFSKNTFTKGMKSNFSQLENTTNSRPILTTTLSSCSEDIMILPEILEEETPENHNVTEQPEVSKLPEISEEPEASKLPEISEEPEASKLPEISEEPEASKLLEISEEPEASKLLEISEEPEASKLLEISEEPEASKLLEISEEPEASKLPEISEEPEASKLPEISEEPEASKLPEISEEPEASKLPEITEEPEASKLPEISEEPEASKLPEISEEPEASKLPEISEPVEASKLSETSEPQETSVLLQTSELQTSKEPQSSEDTKLSNISEISAQQESDRNPDKLEKPDPAVIPSTSMSEKILDISEGSPSSEQPELLESPETINSSSDKMKENPDTTVQSDEDDDEFDTYL